MTHTTFTWQSRRGETIFAQEWRPDTTPRGVVVLIHGLGEHSGRYQHVANFFNQAGYGLMSMDLPGHGKTTGQRGYSSFEEISQEVNALLTDARQRYPGLPIFLYGHSMGGALGLYFILRFQPALQGAIITSPGLQPGTPVAPPRLMIAKIMPVLYPAFAVANGLDRENLSRDPQVVERYAQDPLVHDRVSALLGKDLLTKGNWIIEHAGDFHLPLLLMQGQDDHIVSPSATEKLAQAVPAQHLTYRTWQGLRHETHNEPEQQLVLQAMVDWLNQQTA